ncbi:Crp/Fnr family transcriptional regulator [Sedimentitalea arenosa]|jgi:CRP-like cAMP-binding protein|uniref:Crp/Fnr family transcriptional regulator n=1 Tax=Sedimentitalea arenosa TaxID=2798803 RepID=A0A8J7IHA2_9RHOB|nr:Crp/Fnr family transcriptional regulator [Arenibacterium arenosum]MBJ6370172.1 Crp/Fnr family transcriptional regulator [Arenibacterium arenosum]
MGARSLPKIGFLSDVSADLRTMLSEQATDVTLQPGDILFEQGDVGDALFAIMSGAVEFSVLAMDGRKLTLDMMRPGALFGEISLFDPGARTATATAVEETLLCRVRHADVLQQIRQRPDLAVDMIHLAGQRMRWMGRQLNEQVFLPLPTRLARKVLHLSPEGSSPPFKISLSQAELAEFVGATREAVSKILSSWKREGVIDSARGGLVVKDLDALQVLAEPDQI